jgi:hypothetical protein
MRFSLKDLLWSVTLASLGVASIVIWLKVDSWENSVPSALVMPLYELLHILTGALFGAAIRKFSQRTWVFSFVGAIVSLVASLLLMFAILSQDNIR